MVSSYSIFQNRHIQCKSNDDINTKGAHKCQVGKFLKSIQSPNISETDSYAKTLRTSHCAIKHIVIVNVVFYTNNPAQQVIIKSISRLCLGIRFSSCYVYWLLTAEYHWILGNYKWGVELGWVYQVNQTPPFLLLLLVDSDLGDLIGGLTIVGRAGAASSLHLGQQTFHGSLRKFSRECKKGFNILYCKCRKVELLVNVCHRHHHYCQHCIKDLTPWLNSFSTGASS